MRRLMIVTSARPGMSKIPLVLMTLAILAATPTAAQDEEVEVVSGTSDTCGPIFGWTEQDIENVETFCAFIPEGATTTVFARDMILWVKVPKGIAEALIADSLQTEQIVKNWMSLWKEISDSLSVTIYVQWEDVEIAKGDTTLFRGDQVTIRGQ